MNEEIIVLGIILSIIFYEFSEMSPGGLIVPGYFALYLNDPKRVAITLFISILTYFIGKLSDKYLVLFGRRKFAFYIILTYVFKCIFKELDLEILIGGEIIGILIPGILAQDMDKNGVIKTIPALVILTIVIKSIYNLSEVLAW